MKTIGFFVNTTKEKALEVVPATVAWLRKKGVESLIADDGMQVVVLKRTAFDIGPIDGETGDDDNCYRQPPPG